MLHTKVNQAEEGDEFKSLKVVRNIKMLGYMIDSRSNN